MKKIIIIGCPGSGKTTLAKKLGKKLCLPVVHLDKLWWRDNWQNVSREEFDCLLMKELQKDEWIIDGNFSRTIPLRMQYCDSVIYLDFSVYTCLFGAIERRIKNYGKSRDDMGGNCKEKFDKEFIEFLGCILTFNKGHRKRYHKMLSEEKDKTVVILKSRKQAEKFLDNIK